MNRNAEQLDKQGLRIVKFAHGGLLRVDIDRDYLLRLVDRLEGGAASVSIPIVGEPEVLYDDDCQYCLVQRRKDKG